MESITDQTRLILRKKKLKEALEDVLATPSGQYFFDQFLRDAGVTRPVFTTDPNELLVREGARRLAMSYIALIADDTVDFLVSRMKVEIHPDKHNPEYNSHE